MTHDVYDRNYAVFFMILGMFSLQKNVYGACDRA